MLLFCETNQFHSLFLIHKFDCTNCLHMSRSMVCISPEAGSPRAAPADDNVDVFRAGQLKHTGEVFFKANSNAVSFVLNF